MTVVSDSQSATMNEFSEYEESAFDACERNKISDHEEDSRSSSFWELMMTMYLPVAAMWLKRSVFGVTMMVRTVILGHLIRLIFGNVSEWASEKTPSWLQPFIHSMGPHKPDMKSWPPPALTALALLTICTLVVHPDGFTWVMLGKAKRTIVAMFQSLSECWHFLIMDYGVMPSIIAFATLAALFLLLYVMIRSLAPKRSSRRTASSADKKKKKRKGHARQRGNHAKSKSGPSTPSRPSGRISTDNAGDIDSQPQTMEKTSDPISLTPNLAVLSSKATGTMKTALRELDDLPETSVGTMPVSIGSLKTNFEKDILCRTRVPSVSTVDTAAMSDDLSCGSTSIRSLPSVSAGSSSMSISTASVEQQPSVAAASIPASAPAPINNTNDQRPKAGNINAKRNKRVGPMNAKPKSSPTHVSHAPSRWDALKPTPSAKQNHHADRQWASGKHIEDQNRNHHTTHRSGNRRGGRGGTPARKGRGHGSSRSSFTTSESQQYRPGNRSPVSKSVLENHDVAFNPLLDVDSVPPPPPGLPCGSYGSAALFYHQQKTAVEKMPCSLSPFRGNPVSARSNVLPSHNKVEEKFYVSPSFLGASTVGGQMFWNDRDSNAPPVRPGMSFWLPPSPSLSLPPSPPHSLEYERVSRGSVKENPFAPDPCYDAKGSEEQIEADLQELGGQMAGSILDF